MKSNPRLTDRKHSDILDAAISEFQEHGFNEARVDRIAERAKVSKRTLYNHFEGKQALFDEIIEIIMARNAAIRHVTFNPNRPIRDQLIEEMHAVVQIADDNYIGLNRVLASEYLRNDALANKIFSREEVSSEPLIPFLEAAMEYGAIRHANAYVAAAQLGGLIKQFFIWPQFLTGQSHTWPISKDEIIEQNVDMFLRYYKAY